MLDGARITRAPLRSGPVNRSERATVVQVEPVNRRPFERGGAQVKVRLLAAVIAVSAVSLVPAAAVTAGPARTAAPRTTEPVDWVDIRITITDTRIRLSRTSVERGVVGRFIVRNIGARVHDFTFGDPTSPAGHVTTGPLK